MYKGFVRPTMEYSCLVWMGASDTSLRQLDRVQHRALYLIGPGTNLPRLSHRRDVGSLSYIYKLHYLANSHPTPTLLQLCYLLQALPTHDQLDSPPLNDTTTSYCLPTLPTRPYDNSGVSPTRPWQRGILSPNPPSASS